MQTRDQQYAIDVYQKATRVKQKFAEKDVKVYGSMCHKLPILIHTAGLVQALTFVDTREKSKTPDGPQTRDDKEKPLQRLLKDLAGTILKDSKEKLLERARQADLQEYMLLTQQVLDALLWYKRFAQSVLDVEDASKADEVIKDE